MDLNTDRYVKNSIHFGNIALIIASILFPSVVVNTFAKSSGIDSGGSNDGDRGGDDKPKTSGHKKGDGNGGGGGMPVPGVPVVKADNKHKDKDKDSNSGL